MAAAPCAALFSSVQRWKFDVPCSMFAFPEGSAQLPSNLRFKIPPLLRRSLPSRFKLSSTPKNAGSNPDCQTLTRKSLALHSNPFTPLPLPRIARAPSLRLALNRSRARANASFTNSLLPITAPSVKYLTLQCNIFAILQLNLCRRLGDQSVQQLCLAQVA